MQYELIAEGNANRVLRRPDGTAIRVSKRGVSPFVIAEYWNSFWRPKLGTYLGNLTPVDDRVYGSVLLIDEIGSVTASREIVAEFKPKWLFQSPAAPLNARSCRTCAIKTLRGQPLHWCSLDLKDKNEECLSLLAAQVAKPEHRHGVVRVLHESDVLDRIAYWQVELQNELHHCMCLRDCTVLIEYNLDKDSYSAHIVDLDPKQGPEAEKKWMQIEQSLQSFYLRESPICRLSRENEVRVENNP